MNVRRWALLLVVAALVSACGPAATPTPDPTATPLPPEAPAAIIEPPTPTPTMIPLPALPSAAAPGQVQPPAQSPGLCSPEVTANTIINVRNGPGMIYQIIGAMQMGEARRVDGKNADASWWYIIFPGGIEGHAWVASSMAT